jgi:inhibitor of cysteine peptidase
MKKYLISFILLLCCNTMLFANTTLSIPTYTTDNLNIQVTSNQPQFIIKLSSNPTTGYSWSLRQYDGQMLTPVRHQYQAGQSGLIGAGGNEYWQFRVNPAAFTVSQQSEIQFVYARPWEKGKSVKQVTFQVTTK